VMSPDETRRVLAVATSLKPDFNSFA
jgi:hypothetical protein